MPGLVLLGTGPLVAVLDGREQHHAWAVLLVTEIEMPAWTCGMTAVFNRSTDYDE